MGIISLWTLEGKRGDGSLAAQATPRLSLGAHLTNFPQGLESTDFSVSPSSCEPHSTDVASQMTKGNQQVKWHSLDSELGSCTDCWSALEYLGNVQGCLWYPWWRGRGLCELTPWKAFYFQVTLDFLPLLFDQFTHVSHHLYSASSIDEHASMNQLLECLWAQEWLLRTIDSLWTSGIK